MFNCFNDHNYFITFMWKFEKIAVFKGHAHLFRLVCDIEERIRQKILRYYVTGYEAAGFDCVNDYNFM